MGVRSHYTTAGLPDSQLRCDVCGGPANWRQRTYSACCAYGEMLCESCEQRNRRQRCEKSGSLRQDFTDLVGWVRAGWGR